MFNILKSLKKNNNKNHLTMILVLLTLLMIFPINVYAKMADYSKFDWDKYYEANKFMWGEICKEEDLDENYKCTEDRILLGQKKFFVRLYKILAMYQKKGLVMSDDLIITTTFFGLSIDHSGNEEGDQDYKEKFYDDDFEEEMKAGILYDDTLDENAYDVEDDFEKITNENAAKLTEDTDTIVSLMRNSIAYYTYCYGIYGDPVEVKKDDESKVLTCPNGGTKTTIYYRKGLVLSAETKCADNISATTGTKGYELGYWTYAGSKLKYDSVLSIPFKIFGSDIEDEYYDQCKEAASLYPEGTKYQYVGQDKKVGRHMSTNKYFDFLKESRYFDNKPHLQDYYQEILDEAGVKCLTNAVCKESLEAADRYDEFEDELIEVRRYIIHQIIDILNENNIPMQYEGYGSEQLEDTGESPNARNSFYWPIGSEEITEREVNLSQVTNKSTDMAKKVNLGFASLSNVLNNINNKKIFDESSTTTVIKFADGTPKYTVDDVESYYGDRTSPITGEPEKNYGIDIRADVGTNIIAVYDGVVSSIKTGCTEGDFTCNDGYGNYIVISHSNGDYTVYAHLGSVSEQIAEGRTVLRGELIGTSGATGYTKTPNFHYELRSGGNSVSFAVDPLSNTPAGKSSPPNPADLRPRGGSTTETAGRSTKFEATSLTMTEFGSAVRSYCASNRKPAIAGEMCSNPELVYETSRSANVDPELVIARAMAEGNSPGVDRHNYWGMGCTNTGGINACITYGSLEAGIQGFAGTVTKYDNLLAMHLKYAYIGKYWYNPGSWPTGGCIYFPYIKSYMSPQRQDEVTGICARQTQCNTGGGDCTPTIQEDQNAYASWQVEEKIGKYMKQVFGT